MAVGARFRVRVGLGESGGDEERVYGFGRPSWKPDSGMRRRITEQRRQRATPREGERDRGKRKGRGASHHVEQLRRRVGVEERRRSSGIGGGTELERSSNGGGDLGLGFAMRRLQAQRGQEGGRGLYLSGAAAGLGVRTKARCGEAHAAARLSRVRAQNVEEEGPDRWDPPVGG